MEGRYVDKALQFCGFNSAATRLYKQQLIPGAIYTGYEGKPHHKASAVQPWEMGIDFSVLRNSI
jgi:hypothetical protein